MATNKTENKQPSTQKSLYQDKFSDARLRVFGNNYIVLDNGYVQVAGLLKDVPELSGSAKWDNATQANPLTAFLEKMADAYYNSPLQIPFFLTGTSPTPTFRMDEMTGMKYKGTENFTFDLEFVIPNVENADDPEKLVTSKVANYFMTNGYEFRRYLVKYGNVHAGSKQSVGKVLGDALFSANESLMNVVDILGDVTAAADIPGLVKEFTVDKTITTVTTTLKSMYENFVEGTGGLGGDDRYRVVNNNKGKAFTGAYLWYVYLCPLLFKKPFVCLITSWSVQHSNEVFTIDGHTFSSYSTVKLGLTCDRVHTMKQFGDMLKEKP